MKDVAQISAGASRPADDVDLDEAADLVENGLIRERVAYFDPLVIAGQLARRPRTWLPFLRAQLARLAAER